MANAIQVIQKKDIPRSPELRIMKVLAAEQTKQLVIQNTFDIIKHPVTMLVAGFTTVEYLQKKGVIPGMAGNMLESAMIGSELWKAVGGGAGLSAIGKTVMEGIGGILTGIMPLLK